MLMEFIKLCRNKEIIAIILATISVIGALVPYFGARHNNMG